ncbi:LOW QUALITY PROTEIN: proteoglycan 4-like [Adelges cooleyi]|uniref:LOW QUALITY PROTEIN: proteoglycan 4-like n=1 Tax=Adelges cooleyi TaxID=133065 RepID=UPI0021804162|nr:LOW QUALITY PROTEIN: proteoglycan 4-like [Adelges cooleyi]
MNDGVGCKTAATGGGDAFVVLMAEPITRGLPPPAPLPPLPLTQPPPSASVDPYKTRPRKPTRKERTAFVVLPDPPPPPTADVANPNTSCSGRVSPFRAYGFKTPEAGRSRASSPRPLRRQASDSQIVAKKKKTAAASSLTDAARRLSASSKDLTAAKPSNKSKASTPKPARKIIPAARRPPVSPTRATKTPQPSKTPKTPQPPKSSLPPKTPLPAKRPQPPKPTAKPPLSPSKPAASKSPTKPKPAASTHGTPNRSSPAKMSNKSPRLSKKPIVNGPPAKTDYSPAATVGGTTTTTTAAATVAENITTGAVTVGSTTSTAATTSAAASTSISAVAPVAIDPETVTRITVTPVTATPPVVVVTQSTAVTNSDPVITQTTAAAVAPPSTRIASTVTPAAPPPIGDPPVRPSVLRVPPVATMTDVTRPKLPPAIKPPAAAATPALSYLTKAIKMDAENPNQSGGRAGMSAFMATRKMSTSNGHKTVAWARPSEKIIVPEPEQEPSGCRRFANRLCCAMKCCPSSKCKGKTCGCRCAAASKCWTAVWKRRPRLCGSTAAAAAAEEGTSGWWSSLRRCCCCCCCCCCKRNKASLSENSELGESTDDLLPLTFFGKLRNRLGGLCCCCCAAAATCFRRCCCCQGKRGDVPKKLVQRKGTPFRCTGCCTNIPKLEAVFVDHSSVMRGAIPVLPLTLAWICLVFNVILPGAGTFSSGVFCLCVGKPRFTVNDTFQSRLGSLLVNAIVAASQLFTVLFCLVGWGWSVWWGVIMIKMAKKYQKVKLVDQSAAAAAETPASVDNNQNKDLV